MRALFWNGPSLAAFTGGIVSRELGYGWIGGAVFGVAFAGAWVAVAWCWARRC